MLNLTQRPFSHKEEMNRLLKLENKSVASFHGLEKYLVDLDTLKAQFGFEEGKSVPFQKTNTTSLQEKMEQYIKILYNLAFYFDIPSNKPGYYEFNWRGKVSGSYFKIQSFYYEIAGVFYNYAVTYVNQGLMILESGKADELKLALRYFRQAMWGFHEASKAANKCVAHGTPVPELGAQFIRCGFHVSAALAYNILYKILKENFKTFTAEQRHSFHKNAYHEYFKAVQSIDETKSGQFQPNLKIKALLASNKCFHIGSILYEKSIEYEKLHSDTLTVGHIGTQIAFLDNLKEVLAELKPYVLESKSPEAMELLTKGEKEVAKLNQLHVENDKIYKAKIPARNDLPQIPESEYKVNPLDQPHVKTIIDELSTICTGKKSMIYKTLENDFEMLINKNRQTLILLVEDSEKRRIDLYQKNNIDVILRMALVKDESDLESKVNEIKKVFGGHKGYADAVESLQKALSIDDLKATSIKSAIEQDFTNDRNFYNQTGFRILGLKESGNQILPSFEKHGITLTHLKQKDLELIAEFNKNKDLIKQIESGNILEDLKKIKESITNSEDLQNLIKKHQIVNEIFHTHIKPKEKSLSKSMNELNSKDMIAQVFFNKKTTDEIYAQLNENISDQIEDFRTMLDKVTQALDKIVQLAKNISKSIGSTNSNAISYQQKIISDINSVYLLYPSMLNNLEAHNNLLKNAECIEQILRDYLMSKDLQKQDIMKNANAFRELNMGDFLGSIFEKNFNLQFFGRK